jgi:hypothetical protein
MIRSHHLNPPQIQATQEIRPHDISRVGLILGQLCTVIRTGD